MSSSLSSLAAAAQQQQQPNSNATVTQRALNAIYVAMDHHQYTRAIKLCQQQIHETNGSSSHIVGQSKPYIVYALLAHAYAKTGQKYKAVCTICTIFGIPTGPVATTTTSTTNNTAATTKTSFPEIQLYLKYSSRYERELVESTTTTTASGEASANAPSTSINANKKGGGNKKSSSAAAAAATAPGASKTSTDPSTTTSVNWDWIDSLEQIPTLPTNIDDWEQQLPSSYDDDGVTIVMESNIVTTIAITLNNVLKFHYTAYQLYMWSISCVEKQLKRLVGSNANTATITTDLHYQMVTLLILYVHKAYMIGVGCLALPQYNTTVQHILLTQLQILAIQLTRLQQQQQSSPLTTTIVQHEQQYCSLLWAAQTALWKYTLQKEATQEPQQLLLLRLAESMAMKCIDTYSTDTTKTELGLAGNDENEVHHINLAPMESFHLYIQTLKLQKKWNVVINFINENLLLTVSKNSQLPPRQTMLEMKVEALQQIIQLDNNASENHDTESNRTISADANTAELVSVLGELLCSFPDDWIYWQQYCDACIDDCNGNVLDGCTRVEQFRQKITALQQGEQSNGEQSDGENQHQQSQKHRIRGPDLLYVELASRRLSYMTAKQKQEPDLHIEDHVTHFIEAIQRYGNDWSNRTSCTYMDLCTYLDQFVHVCTTDHACTMVKWVKTIRTSCTPNNPVLKERQKQLRTYIFAVQVSFHLLRNFIDLQMDELIKWEELVEVWQSFQACEMLENIDQAQMESRPGDELILLAVQRLLNDTHPQHLPTTMDCMIAATILESAIRYSPYNPHLKICAIHVYGKLYAPSRCWELFNDLNIKHIQYESLSFLILPILRSGGMFHETILICREIIGLHLSSARDVPDYMGRAMECGNIRKAEEFLLFHREKMTKSLTTFEAKGLILDMAPLLVDDNDGTVGLEQGIVGAETDFDRVKQMITEAHNPNVVFSVLQTRDEFDKILKKLSDNRDTSVLSYEILWTRDRTTAEIILSETLRRGHQHNLLIRAALCIEGARGPKKGKVTKSSMELQKRCTSLLNFARATDHLCGSIITSNSNKLFLYIVRELCIVIVALSSGLDSESGSFTLESLDSREAAVSISLNKAIELLRQVKSHFEESSNWTVSDICLVTADSIVSVFAILEMVAKLFDLFGWGRRKRKTKQCSAAVATFGSIFSELISIMITAAKWFVFISSIPKFSLQDSEIAEQLPDAVESGIFHITSELVKASQEKTQERIALILTYIQRRLDLLSSED